MNDIQYTFMTHLKYTFCQQSIFNMPNSFPSPFTIFNPQLISHLQTIFWKYNNTKFCYAQLSHRSQHYAKINNQSQELIKEYYHVPQNYHILFMPNQTQYSSIPFNLGKFVNNIGMYLVEDKESQFAYREALKINQKSVRIQSLEGRKQVALGNMEKPYYYYTFYNKMSLQTGVIKPDIEPQQGEILICNLNHCSYYQGVDISKHGLVFFQTGHGFGLAGMTVVILRKDLVGFQSNTCIDMMNFEKAIIAKSIVNTPFTFVPLLIAEQIKDWKKKESNLGKVGEKLKGIKEQFIRELSKKTAVRQTDSPGLIILKAPQNINEQKINEIGWRFNDQIVIIIQQQNEGNALTFVQHLFQS